MAVSLLSHPVSDLTLGKPPLPWLPLRASVGDALQTFSRLHEKEISVWDCFPGTHRSTCASDDLDSSHEGAIQGPDAWHRRRTGLCRCVGKVCLLNIICYLSTDESLSNLSKALRAPLSVLIPDNHVAVLQIDAFASLSEAMDLIAGGTQNLVVAIEDTYRKHLRQRLSVPTIHNGRNYCWLTQEDVIRFLLGFIGVLSPLLMMSIQDLGVISTNVLMVEADEDAISALDAVQQAAHQMTAVAVVEYDDDDSAKLIGEIASSSIQSCDETAALAFATLSVRDFLTYTQDCMNPPEALMETIRSRIGKKKIALSESMENSELISELAAAKVQIPKMEVWEESEESSDDECASDSPTGPLEFSHQWFSDHHRPGKGGQGARSRVTPIVCHPWSSLVAVLVQALAHRESYVWVTEEDNRLVGMVTFGNILEELLNQLDSCA